MNQEIKKILSYKGIKDPVFSSSLVAFYYRAAILIFPAAIAYIILYQLGFYQLSSYQLLQTAAAICMSIVVLFFRKKNWVVKHFLLIHWLFIFCFTSSTLVWYLETPNPESLLSFMLSAFLGGLMIVHPLATIIYFFTIVSILIIFSFFHVTVEIKHAFYVFFSGIIIAIFSVWREVLSRRNNLASESYRNLFSELTEQIYVLDDDLSILDLNKTAQEYLKNKIYITARGKKFNEVFCSNDDSDMRRFQDSIASAKSGIKKTFEAKCAIVGSIDFLQKEFTIRKSWYFDKEVLILTVRSIQEQKDFENRLLESKENISRVLENISSFVFNITLLPNGNNQVNYVSSKVKEVYGIEADEYITLVKSNRLSEIFYYEDRVEAIQRFDEVVRTCTQNHIKFRIVREGEIRWIEEKVFPKKITSAGRVQLFGIVTDITDQIQSIVSLEASEKRYRQMFERNLAGVYKTHVDGTIIDANKAFARILGFDSVHELKKHNVKSLYYYQEDRSEYLAKLRKEGFLNNYISYLRRQDGKKIILNNNVSIQPDEDDNLNIIEGTLIDITDLQETADALKMSEEKYRLLFEESKEGIFVISSTQNSSQIIDLNQGAAELLGYTKEEIVESDFDKYVVNAAKLKEQFVDEKLNIKKLETDWCFIKKDGTEFVAETSVVTIHIGEEAIVQLVFKDISERKKNEEKLKESQQSFKNIVDNSPAAILIFTNNQLVYFNRLGEQTYLERLNVKSKNLFDVFPEKHKHILIEVLSGNDNPNSIFTEIELVNQDDVRQYSLSAVKTLYNNQKSDLLFLQDVTLQTEYNRQKLRAEIAEDTNKNLNEEIIRHKETQARLLEKTYWLNALFESSYNLFIFSIDSKFRVSSFNENFKRMVKTNVQKEVEIGDDFLAIFDTKPDARKKVEKRFELALKGETLEFTSHFTSLTGEVWIESFINPVRLGDQEIKEISVVSHEITDKMVSQQKIKHSEENNRAILRAIPDLIVKLNKDGVFTEFRSNVGHKFIFLDSQLNAETILGKRLMDVVSDKEVGLKFLENVRRVIDNHEVLTDTIKFSDENGRTLYYENRFSRMNDDEVIILSRNITDNIEYELMLVESVKEKEILLKEVHHRVKNNLQVINSILNLQSSYVEDPKTLEIINESQNRIRSMSYIHESLYQTKDFASINFAEYITNLVQNLVHSYQLYHDKIDLKFNVKSIKLALDQAIPCGLILNELVSNALKYAYPGDTRGKIVIEVSEKNNLVQIGVEDFGIGLPKEFNIESSESLGLSLVYTLVDQLDGELNLKTLGGTKFLITFEKQEI